MMVFLDDIRDPPTSDPWIVVRSVEDFKNLVRDKLDDIEVLSFDHDLGENVETGYDAMKWLVFDMEFEFRNVQVLIHSANPVGAENIKALYLRWVNYLAEDEEIDEID